MNWTTLVSCEALAAALGAPDLVVVDCRFVLAGADPGAGWRAWRESRIPGAAYAHLDDDLSDHSRPASEGRHPLPEPAAFAATRARLGVRASSQVVAYDAGDGAMAAARLWWLLKLTGHRRVAVLDGGFARWRLLGLPVDDAEPDVGDDAGPEVSLRDATAAGSRPVAAFDRRAIATTDDVLARLHEPPGWLLDARGAERFRGDVEPLDPVAGHIPGARNRPYPHNLREGVFKPADELRADFEGLLGGRDPRDVVLSCGSGVTACHNLLAMEHAGLHGARIYAPSWSGWVSDRTRPVATGD